MMDALHDGDFRENAAELADHAAVARKYAPPAYLLRHYWWAYVDPRAVRLFERQWLVNAILWGNYRRLRDAALDALGSDLGGRTLQAACAYGDFTATLAARVAKARGDLEVVDALSIQIDNLDAKLPRDTEVRTHVMNAAALDFSNARFDRVVLFFLLHEQPDDIRRRTLAEALRVVKPGGRIVVVDYAQPRWWNPLRWLMSPILEILEPFARDLWRQDIADFAPARDVAATRPRRFFGGLYQLVVLTRDV